MENNNDIIKHFYKIIEEKGYKGKILSAEHIPDIRYDITKHQTENSFDPEFYKHYQSFFEFKTDEDLPQIRSLFIISVPVPQFEAIFHWKNERISLLIPPTYLYGLNIVNQITELVNQLLKPSGYKAVYARIPQKIIAVHSGLAEYGRNNITYVSGMGSFHRLTTLYSDFPTEENNWQELKMMDLCKECSACTQKCPTGAIPSDRFLLRAERCITFHNELPPEIAFPDWFDPSWHNCLVGCLHCQKVCPANKKIIDWTEPGPEFSEEELNLILKGESIEELPVETRKKIEDFDLENYYEALPRNLGIFFK